MARKKGLPPGGGGNDGQPPGFALGDPGAGVPVGGADVPAVLPKIPPMRSRREEGQDGQKVVGVVPLAAPGEDQRLLDITARVLELRRNGWTTLEISEATGLSQSEVSATLRRALEALVLLPTLEARKLDVEQTQGVLRRLGEVLDNGVKTSDRIDAAGAYLKALEHRAKVLGLYQPVVINAQHTGPDGGPIQLDWRVRLGRLAADPRIADVLSMIAAPDPAGVVVAGESEEVPQSGEGKGDGEEGSLVKAKDGEGAKE